MQEEKREECNKAVLNTDHDSQDTKEIVQLHEDESEFVEAQSREVTEESLKTHPLIKKVDYMEGLYLFCPDKSTTPGDKSHSDFITFLTTRRLKQFKDEDNS